MIRRLIGDRSGGSAAEFALVLPALLVVIFGTIDVGRWLWVYNEAEKATQVGARMAVVTNTIEPGLSATYIGVNGLTQGDTIAASSFGKVSCTNAGCNCTATPCPTAGTADTAAFTRVVNRMKEILPDIAAANVVVEYSSSGLGYAGNPYGADLSPMVTVKLGDPALATPLRFTPIVAFQLASMNMPTFTTTLSGEDLNGVHSN